MLAVAAALLGAGCDGPIVMVDAASPADAFVPPDAFASIDAARPPDSNVPDGFVVPDAFAPLDVIEVPDAFEAADAFEPPDAYETPDSFVELGCGDGIRSGAEGCDDGDLEPGDGCDAVCQAEVVDVAVLSTTRARSLGALAVRLPTASGPAGAVSLGASGVDDLGNVVVTWTRYIEGTTSPLEYDVLIQRFDRRMTPVDPAPVVIATRQNGREYSSPGVLPMSSGWVLLRVDNVGSTFRGHYIVLPPTGAVPAAREISAGVSIDDLTAARLDSGFVIGWQVSTVPSYVRAAVFDLTGRAVGAAFDVEPRPEPVEQQFVIVGRGGDRWTAAWVRGLTEHETQLRDYELRTAGPTRRSYEPILMQRGASSVDDWLVLGGLAMNDFHSVEVGAMQDGVDYPDSSHWVSQGSGRPIEREMSSASLGGGAWFSVYMSNGTPPVIVASPGASRPLGSDAFEASTNSDTDCITIGRAGPRVEDGWILTWVQNDNTLDVQHVRTLRLAPAPTSG